MRETKRINAYGKRSTRIIYVSDDRVPHASPLKPHHTSSENNLTIHPTPSARKGRLLHKVHLSTSPRGSPKSASVFGRSRLKNWQVAVTPRRIPLNLKAANVSDSPSIACIDDGTAPSHTQVSHFTPFVDPEMVVIEASATGKMIQHKEHKVPDGPIDEVVRPPRRRAQKRAIVVTEDEDEVRKELALKRSPGSAPTEPILIESDGSSNDGSKIVSCKAQAASKPLLPELQQYPKSKNRRVQVEVPLIISKSTRQHAPGHVEPPMARPRSPRRSRRKVLVPSQKLNHPTLAELTSESEVAPEGASLPKPKPKHKPKLCAAPSAPSTNRASINQQYLAPLLAECGQVIPYCFSAFIETFPFDQIHGRNALAGLAFRKIGEASFSEVFAIGKVVLKIVPLRNESAKVTVDQDLDIPQESDTNNVLQEVIVTRAMGQVCRGFVKLLRTYVVLGSYPSLLLSLWDAFNDNRGSESIRPDVFPSTQAYALIVLPHGGPDLETYTFPVKTAWRQACSIFWQTAKALATAEDLVSFEHRDLHWGQILVENTTRKVVPRTPARQQMIEVSSIPMDDPSHGVTVTIIDLGLARVDAREPGQNAVYWTPFDELIFEGEGDYQFDVYRMMRELHGNTWEQFRPLTNVMWLHYLLLKLLRAKRLRPPAKRNVAVDGEFSEKQCYECLLDLESQLGNCLSQTKCKKGRGSIKDIAFCKAGDIVAFAKGRGWLLDVK